MCELSAFPVVILPFLTISLFSWKRRRFAVGSVCKRCLSYSSHISFLLIPSKSRSESCSTLIGASSFIAPKVYDALFIAIGFVSLMATFIFVVSASRAFCLACSFSKSISSSVSIGLFRVGEREVVPHLRRLLIANSLVLAGL